MSEEELFEEVRKIFDDLVVDSSEDAVILVEGARDEKVLRAAGVRGKILLASRVEKELEKMPKPSKVILLLDFDAEGMKNLKKLALILTSRGYRVDDSYHRKLRILRRVGITTVEGIRRILET